MSYEMTDRDLNNLFRGIRNVVDVRVAIDRRTGQPRGFAHADFIDVKSAQEALKTLSTKETYGRKLRLDFSFANSSAARNQQQPPPTN
jgi:nucleolin